MSPARRATLLLLATTVLWGSSFFTMDWGTRGLAPHVGPAAAPSAFLFLRFLAAALLQVAIFPGLVKGLSGPVVRAGVLLSVPLSAVFNLKTTGVVWATSPFLALMTSLFVVSSPVMGRLFFGER